MDEDFKDDFGDIKSYDKGIKTLNLSSWEEFHKVVRIFNGNKYYIWRGQRKESWKLESSFDHYNNFIKKEDRDRELKRILSNFKEKLNDLPNIHNNDLSKENIMWSIGQHYGLSTPLLDWTEIPYFAAYFAFYKKYKKEQYNRVIYALNINLKLLLQKMILKKRGKKIGVASSERFVDFLNLEDTFDDKLNKRLERQKSRFTKALNGTDIETNLKIFWEKNYRRNNFTTEVILTKILIPNNCHDDCINSLKSMNITHGVLFPDYAGAVDICKIDLDAKVVSRRSL